MQLRKTVSKERERSILAESEASKGKFARISPSQAYAENEETFRQAVLSLPAAIYTTDREGRITLYNERAAEMWGRRPVLGKDMWCGSWRIYKPDGHLLPHEMCPMAVALREGRSVQGEIIVERPDGKRISVYANPVPMRNNAGEITGAVNMLVDITDRKLVEDEIQELNRSLEARVIDRTTQLEAFCYSIAHDLRQHIRNVALNSRFIEELLPGIDGESGEALNRLVASAKQMERLVSDLLTYARSSWMDLPRSAVDLSGLAVDIANQLRQAYPDPEFRIQKGLEVIGDASTLSVVIWNLFDNACKYADPSRPPLIEFGFGLGVYFVRDNGQGFDMSYSQKVFQPFQRLHRQADVPGTGIGLASVRQIIEKRGGSIWVESRPGKGSTFFFTLNEGNFRQ